MLTNMSKNNHFCYQFWLNCFEYGLNECVNEIYLIMLNCFDFNCTFQPLWKNYDITMVWLIKLGLDIVTRGSIYLAMMTVWRPSCPEYSVAECRHAAGSRRDQLALRWLSKKGETVDFTYAELRDGTNRFANLLKLDSGVKLLF